MKTKTRAEIIADAVKLRSEIRQIFADAAHWNESVRKPHEERINPDPGGRLTRIAAALDKMLEREEALGHG